MVSEGKCRCCNKIYKQTGMTRHLSSHLKAATNEKNDHHYYHLTIGEGPYFLHLLINETTKLVELDSFLREVWLECCGHLSDFMFKGEPRTFDFDDNSRMKRTIKEVLKKGQTGTHIYDFGSSTHLQLKSIERYSLSKKLPNITILSRNEDLDHKCRDCGKPADYIHLEAIYEVDNPFFCKKCLKKSKEYDDEMISDICNSPRMGVCGYNDDTTTPLFKVVELT